MPCRFHIARVCLYFYQGKEHAKHYCKRGKGKQKEHKQFCGVVGPINNPVVVIPYNQIVVSCK